MKQVVTESNLASLNIHARPGSTGNRLCCQKASGGCAPPTPPPPLSLSSDPFASHMIRMLLQFFGCSLRRAQVRWKVLTGLKKQHCSLSLILIACASFAGKHQKCMWSGNEGVPAAQQATRTRGTVMLIPLAFPSLEAGVTGNDFCFFIYKDGKRQSVFLI